MAIEAGIDIVEVDETADEEAGADQQNQREGDLDDDERFGKRSFGRAGAGGTAVLEDVGELEASGAESGKSAEEKCSANGNGEGEEQKARVDGDIERQHVRTGGDHAEEKMICQHGDSDAERAAESGEQQRFCEELTDEARTPGAECLADGELASAGGGASKQQVGDVGAGDQQNDAAEGHEHLERLRELAAELRETGGDGGERNVSFLQLGEVLLVGVIVAIAEPDLMEEKVDVGRLPARARRRA